MDGTTITSGSFTLTGPSGAVAATVGYDNASQKATLSPAAALAANRTEERRVGKEGKAQEGVELASAYSWTFTTVNAAPTVTANTPANNATAVAPSVAPTAT